jgi:uncharacterized membrane protein
MSTLSRFRLLRQIRARPRLAISAIVGALVVFALPHSLAQHLITRLIIGWNVGAIFYIVLASVMMARSTREKMQRRACAQDDGQFAILILVALAAIVSLAAIVAELAIVKEMKGELKFAHIGLAILTIMTSWAFTHIMFALHYAHDYYEEIRMGRPGGLEFPGTSEPQYSDFLYTAFIIGTSGQTADVSFTTSTMRKVALLHCVLAFVFNTTLLAMTINVAAGLF